METFEKLFKELEEGYQIYFIYLDKKYLVYKTNENCYTQELITILEKSPHPIKQMITLKRLKETYPFMSEIEYKIGI